MKFKALIAIIVAVLVVFLSAAYTIDETEQVVITQFGKAMGEPKTEAGLYFKVPIIQQANYFPKNLLEWDGDPGQIPTLDKTFIWVDTFARWKIVDPLKFFQTVNNEIAAQARLDDIIDPAVRNFITSYPLRETVRLTNRDMDTFDVVVGQSTEGRSFSKITSGRVKIINGILKQASPKLSGFGIELVDVAIKRLNYVEEVRKSVYGRMIAERRQIAEKFRSEGEGEARKIEGNREKELKRITSEAYRTAEKIKGKADGHATRIYAKAYNRDPDFYSFLESLEVYKNVMDKDTSLILSTNSDFLKFFKGLEGGKN
jgi:membrane protease subunit HflC